MSSPARLSITGSPRWGRAHHASSLLASLLALSLAACAGTVQNATRPATALDVPEELDEATYARVERAYRRLAPDDPQRPDVRKKLVSHLVTRAERARAADEYDHVVEELAGITSLYRPEELAKDLPPALFDVAEYLRKEGERRG